MKKMLLLLALIVVPAWAADVAPTPSSAASAAEAAPTAKPAPKHKTSKHKKKTAATAIAPKARGMSTTALTCVKQTCGGNIGCYQPKCGPSCTGC